jgi:hypothetical protein
VSAEVGVTSENTDHAVKEFASSGAHQDGLAGVEEAFIGELHRHGAQLLEVAVDRREIGGRTARADGSLVSLDTSRSQVARRLSGSTDIMRPSPRAHAGASTVSADLDKHADRSPAARGLQSIIQRLDAVDGIDQAENLDRA